MIRNWGPVVPPSGRYPGATGHLFDSGGFVIDKTARGTRWGDGSQWAGSTTASKSFWRCRFVEIWHLHKRIVARNQG